MDRHVKLGGEDMFGSAGSILLFLLIPAAATLLGGVLAAVRPPGERARSAFQHFAAGTVFAAVAGELIPEITREHQPLGVVVGFALGLGLMLALERLTSAGDAESSPVSAVATIATPGQASARGLAIVVGVDIFIDGVLIGVSSAASGGSGVLVALALTVELLFLGLSTATALLRAGTSRRGVVVITAALTASLVLGVGVGALLLGGLTGFALEVVLSFAAAALLYLVVEELLVEAHAVKETAPLTASFFAGFLALLVLELLVQPAQAPSVATRPVAASSMTAVVSKP